MNGRWDDAIGDVKDMMMDEQDQHAADQATETYRPLSAVKTGALGRCPRCGEGRIFRGFLTLRDRCELCGLDYSFADPADGPAVFVQLFACVPGVIFIVMLEILARPGLWVHIAVGIPVLILTTILPLRPIKGWLVAAQYVTKAQEAGTAQLWAKLHGESADRRSGR